MKNLNHFIESALGFFVYKSKALHIDTPKANDAKIRYSVLTKGILLAELADLPMDNKYGITVVSLNKNIIYQYEPGAAPIQERVAALLNLSARVCKTWVSIESYPTPNIIVKEMQ